ncbi:hypothetical protein NX059_011676 [Plenodomus lindquistii]|nr:hypothetical protein NX059_011676 [Plenodomus lindquistii]
MSSPQSTTAGGASNPNCHPAIELVELSLSNYAASRAPGEEPSQPSHADAFEPSEASSTLYPSRQASHGASVYSNTSLVAPAPADVPLKSRPDRASNGNNVPASHSPGQLESQSAQTPHLTRSQRIQNLWFHWSTAYRLIIAFTLAVNISMLVFVAVKHRNSHDILVATATNLLVAVLVRQEDLINATFAFVAKTPVTWPLGLRKVIADLHHYGGLHVGSAISALLWYIFFVVTSTISIAHHQQLATMTPWLWGSIITSYIFMVCLILVCITAHPRLRSKFHNTFEHTHRFGGWFALLVLWINSGVASRGPDTVIPIYKSGALWLLFLTTSLVILPWLRIQRVPVTATQVSNREVKLTFPFANMPYTSTVKFAHSPMDEWHAFATCPSTEGSSASILISGAGDWTRAMIAAPATNLWMRNPPAVNFLALSPIFKSLLLVGTGAGIGPVLSLLTSPAIRRMREQGKLIKVLWTVAGPEQPHWQFVQDIIRSVDSTPSILTSRGVRPQVAFEAGELVRKHELEAVMVVSNPKLTEEVLCKVKGMGVPAYGAAFDS